MKKCLKLFVLLCLLVVIPFNAFALLEIDEQGNPITRGEGKNEVNITSIDEGLVSPDTPVSSDLEDKVDKDDKVYQDTNDTDAVYKTQDDMALEATTQETESITNTWYIVISTLMGVVIGSILTYYIILKRK